VAQLGGRRDEMIVPGTREVDMNGSGEVPWTDCISLGDEPVNDLTVIESPDGKLRVCPSFDSVARVIVSVGVSSGEAVIRRDRWGVVGVSICVRKVIVGRLSTPRSSGCG